jgi:hypothetical protein
MAELIATSPSRQLYDGEFRAYIGRPITAFGDVLTLIALARSQSDEAGVDPVSWTLHPLGGGGVQMPRDRSKKQRVYPPEFRQQLLELVRAGRTPEELSRKFEPSGANDPELGAASGSGSGRAGG